MILPIRNFKNRKYCAWNCNIRKDFKEKLENYKRIQPEVNHLLRVVSELNHIVKVPSWTDEYIELDIDAQLNYIEISLKSINDDKHSLVFNHNGKLISFITNKSDMKAVSDTMRRYIRAISEYCIGECVKYEKLNPLKVENIKL